MQPMKKQCDKGHFIEVLVESSFQLVDLKTFQAFKSTQLTFTPMTFQHVNEYLPPRRNGFCTLPFNLPILASQNRDRHHLLSHCSKVCVGVET